MEGRERREEIKGRVREKAVWLLLERISEAAVTVEAGIAVVEGRRERRRKGRKEEGDIVVVGVWGVVSRVCYELVVREASFIVHIGGKPTKV